MFQANPWLTSSLLYCRADPGRFTKALQQSLVAERQITSLTVHADDFDLEVLHLNLFVSVAKLARMSLLLPLKPDLLLLEPFTGITQCQLSFLSWSVEEPVSLQPLAALIMLESLTVSAGHCIDLPLRHGLTDLTIECTSHVKCADTKAIPMLQSLTVCEDLSLIVHHHQIAALPSISLLALTLDSYVATVNADFYLDSWFFVPHELSRLVHLEDLTLSVESDDVLVNAFGIVPKLKQLNS